MLCLRLGVLRAEQISFEADSAELIGLFGLTGLRTFGAYGGS